MANSYINMVCTGTGLLILFLYFCLALGVFLYFYRFNRGKSYNFEHTFWKDSFFGSLIQIMLILIIISLNFKVYFLFIEFHIRFSSVCLYFHIILLNLVTQYFNFCSEINSSWFMIFEQRFVEFEKRQTVTQIWWVSPCYSMIDIFIINYFIS